MTYVKRETDVRQKNWPIDVVLPLYIMDPSGYQHTENRHRPKI